MKSLTFPYTLILLCVLLGTVVSAQENQQYIIKAGMRPGEVLTFKDIYLYPSFTPGKVYFSNQTVGSGMMNYNRFTGEIDFIEGKDTLALEGEMVKNIIVGKDVFYYQVDIGYVQTIAETAGVKLAKKDAMQVTGNRRHPNSATAGPTSNGSYNGFITTGAGVASGLSLNMVEKVDLVYVRKTTYYFGNEKGFYVKPGKVSLIRLYPGKRKILTSYFNEHEVDFRNSVVVQDIFKVLAEVN